MAHDARRFGRLRSQEHNQATQRERQRAVHRGRRWPVGTIMPDDTRDRLIALEVEVKHLVGMVEMYSGILADLQQAHLKAQGS